MHYFEHLISQLEWEICFGRNNKIKLLQTLAELDSVQFLTSEKETPVRVKKKLVVDTNTAPMQNQSKYKPYRVQQVTLNSIILLKD